MAGWRYVAIALVAGACGHSYFDPVADARVADGVTASPANVAFVTSTTQLPTTFGSDLSGADALCMARAQSAGLAGKFIALLSTSAINARDRLAGSRGWVRKDGKPVLDLPDDMESGKMFYPIDLDESGAYVNDNVATGSMSDGSVDSGNECNNYSDPSMYVDYGVATSTSSDWIYSGDASCTQALRIYCFGLGLDAPLVVPPPTGRLAFVTTQPFAIDAGGIGTADTLCMSEAQLAGLSGTFRALLATSTASAMSRFSLTGANWQRLDGIAIATSPLAFSGQNLDAPINVTSTRTYLGSSPVMTGANDIEQPNASVAQTCNDWTNAGGMGLVGLANSIDSPFDFQGSQDGCGGPPIYCLQQ